MAFTQQLNTFFSSTQEGSVLVLTLAMMLVFSGQVLMMGMVTTKSLTETGALQTIGMSAREEAFSAMQDFEAREIYPQFLTWVTTSKTTLGAQHVTATTFLNSYGNAAGFRSNIATNFSKTNWSTYRNRIWDEATNQYVDGVFAVNVWLDTSSGWPYTVVANVTGSGINQTIRRRSSVIPPGYSDTES